MHEETTPADGSWCTREVAVFLALALGVTWIAAGVRASSRFEAADGVLRWVIKYGPSLAGLIATAMFAGRRGLSRLLRRLSPALTGPGWILFALLLPVSLGAVTLGLRVIVAGPVAIADGLAFAGACQIFGSELAQRFFLGGGLGEELGWRGFMLPRVQERVGWLQASVWVGLWHGLWHLPAQGAAVLVLTVYTIAASILLTWLASRTKGSVFLAALLHASGNATLFSMEKIWPSLNDEPLVQLVFLGLWLAVAAVVIAAQGSREPVPTPDSD